MKSSQKALLTISLLCGVAMAASVHAQDEEKELGWSDVAEVIYVATSGNAEANTLAFRNSLARTWEAALLTFDAGAFRASTGAISRSAIGTSATDFAVVKDSLSAVTAENYFARGRYDRNINERLFWFGGGGWDRNVFAGIQNRFEGIGGVGNIWFDNETRRFRTDYGISLVHQEDVVDDPTTDDTFVAVRASSDYMRKLTDTVEYTNLMIISDNMSDTSDFRWEMVNALSVSMTSRLALKLSHQLLFDNKPSLGELPLLAQNGTPLGFTVTAPLDKVDTVFNVALVLTF